MENKVRFTIKNCHVAPIKVPAAGEAASGAVEYDAPIPVPGTVSLDLGANGELTKFYADGITYWQGESNNGYEGDWETANFPEKLEPILWGIELNDKDKVLIENANKTGKAFALLFEIVGDVTARKYCLYNCTSKRPNVGGKTSGENKEPQTVASTISAIPLPNGNIKASTSAETPADVVANWYKQVYQPSAEPAA